MGVTVNISKDKFLPCYHHLLDGSEFFDIDFLWGGRDSGKSRHVAQQLIVDCLRQKYFKCLLIRSVLNSVRDSQFSLLKSVIQEWNLSQFFDVNETRMEIICNLNGNGFYGRGMDNIGKIKSFNNPSCAWVEEGNQIENDDFTVMMTSLRANNVKVKIWFTFNPECDMNYTDFWLWQEYFSHTEKLSWTWEKTISVGDEVVKFNVRSTHTTYKDNRYCSPQRKALYESYKNSKNNAYWYQTYTLGLWGYKESGSRFLPCFDRQVHVSDFDVWADLVPSLAVDNNVDPYIAVQMWQYNSAQSKLRQFDEVAASDPNNTATKAAKKAAERLRHHGFHSGSVFLYGDSTAQKRSTEDDEGRSFFAKFIATLESEGFRVINRIGKSNPGVVASAEFINDILESNYDGLTIEVNSRCVKSIEDYVMTKKDADGTILKKSVMNKETGVSRQLWGHFTDDMRYVVTSMAESSYLKHKARHRKRQGSYAAD